MKTDKTEILEGNKLIAEFMGVTIKNAYKNTGRKDDNGIPILEGSVIIADGYGKDDGMFYCVVWDEDENNFGSCAYGDFELLSWYKSIIVKGHCEDYRHLIDTDEWSGNLGGALKDDMDLQYHEKWDWLMPVVQKIHENIGVMLVYPTITQTFESVVSYVKWHNSQYGR